MDRPCERLGLVNSHSRRDQTCGQSPEEARISCCGAWTISQTCEQSLVEARTCAIFVANLQWVHSCGSVEILLETYSDFIADL